MYGIMLYRSEINQSINQSISLIGLIHRLFIRPVHHKNAQTNFEYQKCSNESNSTAYTIGHGQILHRCGVEQDVVENVVLISECIVGVLY